MASKVRAAENGTIVCTFAAANPSYGGRVARTQAGRQFAGQ